MPDVSFTSLFVVSLAGFCAPLALGFVPSLRLPAVVLEIVIGIVIGPHGLGWVSIDLPVQVLSVVGLAFLLFLSGLEIDLERLRGRSLRLAGGGFLLSIVLALAAGYGLSAAGLYDSPLLVAIILLATSLGIVVPVLKDAGETGSPFGQIAIAGASIADFSAIILLSLFFSRESTGTGTKVFLLVAFAVTVAVAGLVIVGLERLALLGRVLVRLQDTTAQIRVRGAFVLMLVFVALASSLGLEVILGAFMAGIILSAVDRDRAMTHPQFRLKLEAVGYGVFVPIFFVSSGLRFDLGALFARSSTLLLVPVFLAALLFVRGLPAIAYRSLLGARRTVVASLLQATSLPFIVAATMIGVEIGALDSATGAALVAAGLLSVVVFPLVALTVLRGADREPAVQRAPTGEHAVASCP